MEEKDMRKIKIKIGALVVLGMFTALVLVQPLSAVDVQQTYIEMEDDEWIGINAHNGGKIYFDDQLGTDEIEIMNANVGIGTQTPGATLDVRGSAIFNEDGGDYDFRIEGDSKANLFFVDASTNSIGIGLNDPAERLEIDGNLLLNSGANREIYVEAINSHGFDLSIHAGSTGGDEMYPGNYNGGDLFLYGGNGLAFGPGPGGYGGDVYIYGGTHFNCLADGDVILAYTGQAARGEVGIGTASPSQLLDVNGKIEIGNDDTAATAGAMRWTGSNFEGYTGSAWVPLDVQATSGGGWTDDGTKVRLTTSTDSVGIGTLNPLGKLQVVGDEVRIGDSGTPGYATGDGDLYVEDALEVDGTIYAGELWAQDSTGIGLKDDSGALGIWVEDGGYVGIGTLSPQGKLEIQSDSSIGTGTISSSGTDVTGTGTSFTTELKVGSEITADGETKKVTAIINNFELDVDSAWTSDLSGDSFTYTNPILLVKNNGDVGIGTTTPQDKLHVSGGSISLENGQAYRWVANPYPVSIGANTVFGYLTFGINGEKMRLEASGNFGIGTTSPDERFEVAWDDPPVDGIDDADVEIGRGTQSGNENITFIALRNEDGEQCWIYPNADQDGIIVSDTHP